MVFLLEKGDLAPLCGGSGGKAVLVHSAEQNHETDRADSHHEVPRVGSLFNGSYGWYRHVEDSLGSHDRRTQPATAQTPSSARAERGRSSESTDQVSRNGAYRWHRPKPGTLRERGFRYVAVLPPNCYLSLGKDTNSVPQRPWCQSAALYRPGLNRAAGAAAKSGSATKINLERDD